MMVQIYFTAVLHDDDLICLAAGKQSPIAVFSCTINVHICILNFFHTLFQGLMTEYHSLTDFFLIIRLKWLPPGEKNKLT